jgi:hypothetical protein
MSVDYFLYSPKHDVAASIGSTGLGGIMPWPGTDEMVAFVRWVIDENIEDVVLVDEHTLDDLRDAAGHDDDSIPRDPPATGGVVPDA